MILDETGETMPKSRRTLGVPLLLLSLLLAAPALGAGDSDEATLDILLQTLRSNRKALVAVNLELSDTEAKAFWPVYDRYEKEFAAIQDRLLAVIQEYTANFASMNDETAEKLIAEYLKVESDHAKLREDYLKPISEVLPGVKVMLFYQIENKIQAVLRYDLAATIPLVVDAQAPR
jgi:hypothetical protein